MLDIIRAVDDGTALLPEFQRDFRWDMEHTYDLFDSLIREIFIGTIIWQAQLRHDTEAYRQEAQKGQEF